MQANEPALPGETTKRDWWNDPLGVFKADANPIALKIHGFIIGMFFGLVGVVAVAVLSSADKRVDRAIGAGLGLAVWFPLAIALSG